MGGDRLGIQKELRQLKAVARRVQRNTVLYEHQEAYDGSWFDEQRAKYCCFCCPFEPDTYTLTNSALKIREFEVKRICGVRCTCLGGAWHNDPIALDRIVDIDTVTTLKGCACFAEHKCEVWISNK